MRTDNFANIREALIKACIKSRPSYFKSFLSSDKVTTEWPDKESFYEFFKYILSASKKISVGELRLADADLQSASFRCGICNPNKNQFGITQSSPLSNFSQIRNNSQKRCFID